ncbi:universal stress protein [Microvirga sp. TS319]|uniref:universal stress protein n=1 Tax=Microvirga sp. TS319 TaxID=3241165 RepID=UPI00351A6BC9
MLRDIIVHLDGGHEDEIRLEHALAIAAAERAHLTGLYTNQLPELTVMVPMDGGAAAIQVLSELEDRARQDGDVIAERLAEKLSGLEVPSEFRRLDDTLGGLLAQVVDQARCADLFVTTRPYGKAGASLWSGLVEAVLFGSGRALLLVPPGRHLQGPINTVLVPWNGSREAARALREGLSFIARADRTVVLVADPPAGEAPGAKVKRHLAHHGVTAEVATAESRGRPVAAAILEEARRLTADLVVMGGYGHTRFREQVFGGVTRDMLTASDRPILLAH